MIIYGVIAEESIVDLFLAGIGPGLVLAAMFIAFSVVHARRAGTDALPDPSSWRERRTRTIRALPTLFLAALILVGLYTGAFTPTEASAVGFVAATVLAGAKVFAKAVTLYRIPQDVSFAIAGAFGEAGMFVTAVCLLLLVMGFVLEALSMLVIMVPVFLPTLAALGIDPIWFGVLFVIMIECALITPPVGLNLFVIQAVGRAPMGEVASGVGPFVVMMLVTVALITLFPEIALVFCPPSDQGEVIAALAISFSVWQCAGHGDAAGLGFVH